jgi:hypothetical protein
VGVKYSTVQCLALKYNKGGRGRSLPLRAKNSASDHCREKEKRRSKILPQISETTKGNEGSLTCPMDTLVQKKKKKRKRVSYRGGEREGLLFCTELEREKVYWTREGGKIFIANILLD